MTRKAVIFALVCSLLMFGFGNGAGAGTTGNSPGYSKINLEIDGNKSYGSAILINNQAMVPLKMITTALGGSLQWVAETKTAKVTSFKASMGTANLIIDGKTIAGSNSCVILNGKAMIPLEQVAQSLGGKVQWDKETRTAKVTSLPGKVNLVKLYGRAATLYMNLNNIGLEIKDAQNELLQVQQSVELQLLKIDPSKLNTPKEVTPSFQKINAVSDTLTNRCDTFLTANSTLIEELKKQGHDSTDIENTLKRYKTSLEQMKTASLNLLVVSSNNNADLLCDYYNNYNYSVDNCNGGLKEMSSGLRKYNTLQQL